MTAADQTPATEAATAAQALAQAVREAAAENIPLRWLGKPDLASSYWEGYRAAAIELADLLDEPALLDQYPALGATPAPQTPAKRCGECRLGLGVHTTTDPYCDHHQTPATDSEREVMALPCDGGCDYNTGPEETCSRHGRPVAEVWGIVDTLQRRLAEQAATIERVRDLHRPGEGYMSDDCVGCREDCAYCEGDHPYPCPTIAALGSQRTEGQG